MTSTFIIGFALWLIGAIVAWFQIKHWNEDNDLLYPEDYVELTLFSLLSWCVYPIYAIEWYCKQINS